ncbi:MAG TPA: tRNA (adenosine(37)-N6)-threonylcarbamoyltransferase complex dimerization subunit type 1 TsaB, partial [Pirellulales bacterium]|nr:tRNA (adenosine(37)-N6)-threonylcarbamoyltransferase complex dimerization subunit type 1 TsaB [Pirellulales bacterium]
LAIETSSAAGSVAALSHENQPSGNLLAELRLNPSQRGAQSLAPALADLLRQAGWKPRDVQLVAVSVGPGSFTALRVGVTTAKTFAYAVSAQVLAIDTSEVIAARVDAPAGQVIATAIDAQRGDVYAATFRRLGPFALEPVQPTKILPADQWIGGLSAGSVVSGPAVEKLAARLPRTVRVASQDAWLPSAEAVARLAIVKYAAGQRDDVWRLVPHYLRPSAAEERRSPVERPS